VTEPPERRPQAPPHGPGETPEQTTLSWERTALTLLAVSAAVTRKTWSELGVVALVPLALFVLVALWVLGEGWRRYDDDRSSLRYRPIGGPTLTLAMATGAAAVVELVALVLR